MIDSEPVRVAAAAKTLIYVLAPGGTLFGWWDITADQLAWVGLAVVAAGEFVSTVWTRSKVSPV